MKRAAWIRLAKLVTAIVFAVAAGTWTMGQLRDREVARLDQQEVARMTDNMKTVCIGRFLIDLPKEAQVELSNPNIDGFDFTSFRESAKKFDRLSRLAAQLGPNPKNSTPFDPGFCLDGAYIRNPLDASQRERIMMSARLPNHPDIESTLILLAGTEPDEKGLLTRNAESNARLSVVERFCVSQLRTAQRTISGLRGEEVLERFAEDNNVSVFSFWWEVGGTSVDVMLPHLSFTMDTGKSDKGPVPSSLSQQAALALWDKISSSIRYHHAPPAPGIRRHAPARSAT